MNTGERLKDLRKNLNLTQQDFANRIGVKRNTIANYEVNRNVPVDAVISLICREFNVNEEWLRHGTGEMFRVIDDSNIYDLLREEYNMTEAEERLIRAYFSMPEEGRKLVMDCIEKAATNLQTAKLQQPQTIDEKVAAYRAQLEREAAEAKLDSSDRPDTPEEAKRRAELHAMVDEQIAKEKAATDAESLCQAG